MFKFLKFRQRNALNVLEHFYQHTTQNAFSKINWVSLAVNKKTYADSFLTKELEILTESDAFHLKIAESKKAYTQGLWQNQRQLCKIQVALHSPLLASFNHLIHQTIEKKIIEFQLELNQSLSTKDFSATEITQDEKALEWIRVSFKILEQAVIKSLTSTDYLFQTLLFLGTNPKSQQKEIRLITFNLDIQFLFQKNGVLRVFIYNDKDARFGDSQKPALQGDFNFRKRF